VALGLLAMLGGYGAWEVVVTPLRLRAEQYDLQQVRRLESASVIYDRRGEELSRIYVLNRTPVSVADLPKHFIHALVAQEDSRFFEHNGVDFIGLMRAVYLNLMAGEVTQGASTITQQLARQTFGLMERSYKRKLMEAFVAQRIEKQYSKTEILELYLNRIFFGRQFYGVQAAALGYFGKEAKDLSLAESATLAGLIKSPNNIEPTRHPQRALKERNHVLRRMVEEGLLDEASAQRVQQEPMQTAPQSGNPRLSYADDAVRQQVAALLGEERAAVGGFKIYTSIDRELQRQAQEAVSRQLAEIEKTPGYAHQTAAQFEQVLEQWRRRRAVEPLSPRPKPEYLQAASLVMDHRTGSILALVGGRNFADSQYNRALDARRPVGTAFTPLVFAHAFSKRQFSPLHLLADEPLGNDRVMIGGFTGILGEYGMEVDQPKWSRQKITAREALVHSHNCATVRMAEESILERGKLKPDFKQWIARAGIESPLRDNAADSLGASEARLDELCLAYSCFANGGWRPKTLHLIERITDAQDQPVYQLAADAGEPQRALDEAAAWQTHTCLTEVMERGTGAPARQYGLKLPAVAGKSGTHHEFKDLWFMGYTPTVTCGVWVGFDRQKTIFEQAFSNRLALPIWSRIMQAAALSDQGGEFHAPENVERVEICRASGRRATPYCLQAIREEQGSRGLLRGLSLEYLRPEQVGEIAACEVHSGQGLAADLEAFARGIMKTASNGPASNAQAGAAALKVNAVAVQDVVVLGQDPYGSEGIVLKARPVTPQGGDAARAVPVEESSMGPLQLPPPPRLKIDL
jgi:penicillin-binding protein 1A